MSGLEGRTLDSTGWWRLGAVMALLVLATVAYWPGLHSGFLFDDYSNLPLLSRFGRVDDWHSFWLYITSGFAGPSGRPVALISFLIDANHWPADPWPFKRTNLIIHLLNGVVVYAIARKLVSLTERHRGPAQWAAVLAAAAWLLHPLWVSTTLYAVQRMTLLSALFALIGIWAWLALRTRKPPVASTAWYVGGLLIVGGLGLFAVLSKENGALLPLYIAVIEGTVLARWDLERGVTPSRGFRRWRACLLGVPLGLMGAYVAYRTVGFYISPPANPDITPWQRLLTQTRILWEYLLHIGLPTPSPGGLYNDGIEVSTSPIHPWTTLPAVAGLIGIGAWALWRRRAYPLAALAILFFLAGHALESSVIRLELYFEHRNYLPAAFVFLPIAAWWCRQSWLTSRLTIGAPIAIILALAVMTGLRAQLWSTPFQQARQWVADRPGSARAHNHLANYWQETGHLEHAQQLTDQAIRLDPDGLPWRIKDVMYTCNKGGDVDEAVTRLTHAVSQRGSLDTVGRYQLSEFFDYVQSRQCPALTDRGTPLSLTEQLRRDGPSDAAYQRMLLEREGRILLNQNQPASAFERFKRLIGRSDNPESQLALAATMASAGHREAALKLLELPPPRDDRDGGIGMSLVRRWYLASTDYYARERSQLRNAIEQDMGGAEGPKAGETQ
jgi:tetratricopeptide (TPR) repeat protein